MLGCGGFSLCVQFWLATDDACRFGTVHMRFLCAGEGGDGAAASHKPRAQRGKVLLVGEGSGCNLG